LIEIILQHKFVKCQNWSDGAILIIPKTCPRNYSWVTAWCVINLCSSIRTNPGLSTPWKKISSSTVSITYLPASTLCFKDPLDISHIWSGIPREKINGCSITKSQRVSSYLCELLKPPTDFLWSTQPVIIGMFIECIPKQGNTGACSFVAISLLKCWKSLVTPLRINKQHWLKCRIQGSPLVHKPNIAFGTCFSLNLISTELWTGLTCNNVTGEDWEFSTTAGLLSEF